MKIKRLGGYLDDILHLYRKGLKRGDPTGWRDFDRIWSAAPKQLTIVTGIPNHGKSAFMDALAVNLLTSTKAEKPWTFLFISPEQEPHELHIAELLERYIGKRFREGNGPRMTIDDVENALANPIGERVKFGSFEEQDSFADMLLAAREFAASAHGMQPGIILDPWNRLEHRRPTHLSETEYISEALSLAVSLTKETGAHLFIIAHPAKLLPDRQTGVRPVPTAYDISGSAHWYNKSDNVLCVWRDTNAAAQEQRSSRITKIYVQKVRWRHLGRLGVCELGFDTNTGRYNDIAGYSTLDRASALAD